jgi:hypothetical protein
MNEGFWLRFGDNDEYTTCDSIEEVAELFHDKEIEGPLERAVGGVFAPGYEGSNYISLYWGNENADLARPLSDEEYAQLVRLVVVERRDVELRIVVNAPVTISETEVAQLVNRVLNNGYADAADTAEGEFLHEDSDIEKILKLNITEPEVVQKTPA